jgi:uncharacterized membrane protein
MWFILSLLSALFQVLRNVAMKRLGHALDDTINVWGRFTFLLPFAGLGVLYTGIPGVQKGFWVFGALFGVTQCLGTFSLSKALKQSDISLVTPLWKLSLILLVAWGYLTLGEIPSLLGLLGLMVSLLGVYLLNIRMARISFWTPIVALIKDPGQRWTLGAAMGYAPSVVLIKKMALLSTPIYAIFIAYVFCFAFMTPYTVIRSWRHFSSIGRFWKDFVGMGICAALSTWFGTTAYTMTVSSYVEAVKQVEVLLALGIGYFLFKEEATVRAIWIGTVVMLAGLVLLKLGT